MNEIMRWINYNNNNNNSRKANSTPFTVHIGSQMHWYCGLKPISASSYSTCAYVCVFVCAYTSNELSNLRKDISLNWMNHSAGEKAYTLYYTVYLLRLLILLLVSLILYAAKLKLFQLLAAYMPNGYIYHSCVCVFCWSHRRFSV